MKHRTPAAFSAGAKVILRSNPHHPAAANIVGTVVAYRNGAGFAGCDIVDIRYENPRDGKVHEMPFGLDHLQVGSRSALLEVAEHYEAMAAELRRLAE